MKSVVQHPTLGEIVYEEGTWSGKRMLSINGVSLTKTGKNTFTYQVGEDTKTVTVQGNYLFGAKLIFGDERIQVAPAPAWYDIVFSVLIFMIPLIWGNVSAMVAVFPVVGGAIGGALAACGAIGHLLLSRIIKKWWQKVLIGCGMLIGVLLVAAGIGSLFLLLLT